MSDKEHLALDILKICAGNAVMCFFQSNFVLGAQKYMWITLAFFNQILIWV